MGMTCGWIAYGRIRSVRRRTRIGNRAEQMRNGGEMRFDMVFART
jgi:hypothetical protein